MTTAPRKPAAFSLDDPRLTVAAPEPSLPMEISASDAPLDMVVPRRHGLRWGTIFWSALSGLVLLGLGLAVATFIEDLFARAPWLGATGLVLAFFAGLALAVVVMREIASLMRLATIETLRERALAIVASDDRDQGRALTSELIALTRRMPRLARARGRLTPHLTEIIDGRDLVRLAERELMAPLDAEARRLVTAASKRVSVVTAISPRAAIDMIFVMVNALGLIRKLAVLYGGRPGTLGVLKLLRQVISHLALTGGAAVSDSLIQQVVGHGLAAKLSARLGEGVLNGLLTARLGLLTIEATRPLPFLELPRPTLNELAGSLLRPADPKGAPDAPPQIP